MCPVIDSYSRSYFPGFGFFFFCLPGSRNSPTAYRKHLVPINFVEYVPYAWAFIFWMFLKGIDNTGL
jgi:hypothetical protein